MIIAAIVADRPAAIWPVWELRFRYGIEPTYFNWIECEVEGNGFNGPFRDIGALRPAVASVGIDRHGAGMNHVPGRNEAAAR